jgi:hypothetical protein
MLFRLFQRPLSSLRDFAVTSLPNGGNGSGLIVLAHYYTAIGRTASPVVIILLPQPSSLSDSRFRGQVAQLVERSPEKAGVGGSIPSLATIIPKNLAARSRNLPPTIPPMILTELAP